MKAIERYLALCIRRGLFPGAVYLVAKRERVLASGALGWAALTPRRRKMREDAVFASHDWAMAKSAVSHGPLECCTQCGLGIREDGAEEFCAMNTEKLLEEDEPDPDDVKRQLHDADDVFGKFDDLL